MASPFPGMDPYLENPAWWGGVHDRLIIYLGDVLTTLLPRGYVADIGERVYVEEAGRSLYPDAAVLRRRRRSTRSGKSQAAAAVATCDQPWIIEDLTDDPVREPFIQILPVGDEKRVISIVEILSPANKAPGTDGRRQYLAKQQLILSSATNLVEIDLLRDGEHTVAVKRSHLVPCGPFHYLVNLSRAQKRDRRDVWGFTLQQRLPRIAVPLEGDHADVVINLQKLFTHCYDAGGYRERIDYRRNPVVPLPPTDSAWAVSLLRKHKLRK
jgi:hypothetical protein